MISLFFFVWVKDVAYGLDSVAGFFIVLVSEDAGIKRNANLDIVTAVYSKSCDGMTYDQAFVLSLFCSCGEATSRT